MSDQTATRNAIHRETIRKHLEEHGTINKRESMELYGIICLAQRIYDLKNPPFDLDIEAEMVTVHDPKLKLDFRCAEYTLVRRAEQTSLF